MGSKWDAEKFTRDNDFGLWKVKMEPVLIQQKCEKALKGEGVLPVTMSQTDKVLRDVAKETTAASVWSNYKVLWWCVVGTMKKVMFLTLGMMPYRAVEFQGESHSGCTRLLVQVEKTQLVVELMTSGMDYQKRPRLDARMVFMKAEGIPMVEELDARMVFKNAEGIPMVEEIEWKLVELHGVVGSKGR
ncbi:hypothetical protein MTR_6g033765 [Medicago truncatula]|uniref:Uncharacterized protein n=1 Tax=Medicago truncatula TaxID=3880 RepID=A0A072U9E9_MEDTR|nr:hypothetical protein MTR_6g033765 [Medicago truncatula]